MFRLDALVFLWSRGVYGESCKTSPFQRCPLSKPDLRDRCNTFASFSEDGFHFSWQAQHFGDLHRHYVALPTCRVACFLRLHTLHFTLHILHSTRCTLHFTLYTLHSTHYTLYFTLCTLHFTVHTLHFTLRAIYTVHSTLHTLHFIHSTLYTLTLLRSPLYTTLCTPQSTLYIPHSRLRTLHTTL